jgi:cytochrome c peroxidase
MEDFIRRLEPPKYPFAIDAQLAAEGAGHYAAHCADCHGKNGRDFSGERVGKTTPIAAIGTDRHRFDSYTRDLAVTQNLLYTGYEDERFRHFKKTDGYANMPLDGIWLRAPYLHNGSVPTLRDLLEPPDQRPTEFHRGYDRFDAERVGFVSDAARDAAATKHFRFDTREPGNGNFGHAYGTRTLGELQPLTEREKAALVEFLKTF